MQLDHNWRPLMNNKFILSSISGGNQSVALLILMESLVSHFVSVCYSGRVVISRIRLGGFH